MKVGYKWGTYLVKWAFISQFAFLLFYFIVYFVHNFAHKHYQGTTAAGFFKGHLTLNEGILILQKVILIH